MGTEPMPCCYCSWCSEGIPTYEVHYKVDEMYFHKKCFLLYAETDVLLKEFIDKPEPPKAA